MAAVTCEDAANDAVHAWIRIERRQLVRDQAARRTMS
jgi:hypothetical protein